MSKVYTKTGDDGTTSLVGGQRVRKTDARLEAYGTVDELNSDIGVVTTYTQDAKDLEDLRWIQGRLFAVGGGLATDLETTPLYDSCRIFQPDIDRVEKMIDDLQEKMPQNRRFVLPGGSRGSAYCNVARAVCRRAERDILRLQETAPVDPLLVIFINRLSDYLFVLSRHMNFVAGVEEVLW
ncbi:MAG: cob(I)yrinic acid a,c-diamide adenosyltransferase [Bacteroidaceae bacterium]|nr:cob(I)yrinic acid a,c-diamide adenosyltransferase [Bacteroidaceae bacterium]